MNIPPLPHAWQVSPKEAMAEELVLACCLRYRLPEPV